jgi:hypothetical protein
LLWAATRLGYLVADDPREQPESYKSLHAEAHCDQVAIADTSGDGLDLSSSFERLFVRLQADHDLALDPCEQCMGCILGSVGE